MRRTTLWLLVTLAFAFNPPAQAQRRGGGRRASGRANRPTVFLHPSRTSRGRVSLGDAKRLLTAGDLGRSILSRALDYVLHDDSGAADKVVEQLESAEPPESFDKLGPWLVEHALAFDWIYTHSDFTSKKRQAVIASLEAGIQRAMWLVNQKQLGPQFAEWVEMLCCAGVAALALYPERGGIKRLRRIHALFVNRFCPFQQRLGGGRHEGPWKGVTRVIAPAMLYIWAYTSVLNKDLASEIDKKYGGWVSRAGQWIIRATLPDGSLVAQGDRPRSFDSRDGFIRLFHLLTQISGYPGYALYRTRLERWWGDNLDRGDPFSELTPLWKSRREQRLRPVREGLGQLFGKATLGHYFGRGADKPGGVRVRFNAGRSLYPDQHRDQGNFTIFRQAPLAVDQGFTAGMDVSAALLKYTRSSLAHNVLRLIPPAGGAEEHGGQVPGKRTGGGRITAVRLTAAGDLITADLTGAYRRTGLVKYTRQLVFLRPGTVIVIDRIKTRAPGWRLVWQLQTADKPLLAEKQPWKVERLGSRLTCRAFRPEGIAPKLVPTVIALAGKDPQGKPKQQTFWRTEFVTRTTRTETTLLFVLQAHETTKPLPVPHLVTERNRLLVTVGARQGVLDSKGRASIRKKR